MVAVSRTGDVLLPDCQRVVARPFVPGHTNFGGPQERVDGILRRIELFDDAQVDAEIDNVTSNFVDRHRDVEATWQRHVDLVAGMASQVESLGRRRQILIGMIFTQEYAFECAAVCNPSMVALGETSPSGSQDFVMSIRSIGEGHISSITFRKGTVDGGGGVKIEPGARWADNGTRRGPRFEKAIYGERLGELGVSNEISAQVLGELDDGFSMGDLEDALARLDDREVAPAVRFETERAMHWLASSNYEVQFDDIPLAERVLSPAGPTESRGMEDARFVRFTDDGEVTYYATYSAYDGFQVLPQLITTKDFRSFRISTLAGSCARSKGLAIFPRKIEGAYVALARTDNESTFVMRSDHIRRWDYAELAHGPTETWEVVQGGNCGSPIELPDGWLVLTHGVGPMRRYVISAVLLDRDDPAKLLARLRTPLLMAEDDERDGYVPNVVYSCGGMIHDKTLVIPYGFSDRGVGVATIEVDEVMSAMD